MESRVSAALQADPSQKTEVQEKRLMNSCQQFTAILVSYMMKTMRKGSSFGEEHGFANGIYQDMLYQQVAKVIAGSGALGLGKMLYTQLERSENAQASLKAPGTAAKVQKALSAQISLNKVINSAE